MPRFTPAGRRAGGLLADLRGWETARLDDARGLNLPEAGQIEQIIEQVGFGSVPTDGAEETGLSAEIEGGDSGVQDNSAGPGWDALTGLGTPEGSKLLDA